MYWERFRVLTYTWHQTQCKRSRGWDWRGFHFPIQHLRGLYSKCPWAPLSAHGCVGFKMRCGHARCWCIAILRQRKVFVRLMNKNLVCGNFSVILLKPYFTVILITVYYHGSNMDWHRWVHNTHTLCLLHTHGHAKVHKYAKQLQIKRLQCESFFLILVESCCCHWWSACALSFCALVEPFLL